MFLQLKKKYIKQIPVGSKVAAIHCVCVLASILNAPKVMQTCMVWGWRAPWWTSLPFQTLYFFLCRSSPRGNRIYNRRPTRNTFPRNFPLRPSHLLLLAKTRVSTLSKKKTCLISNSFPTTVAEAALEATSAHQAPLMPLLLPCKVVHDWSLTDINFCCIQVGDLGSKLEVLDPSWGSSLRPPNKQQWCPRRLIRWGKIQSAILCRLIN